MHRLQHLWAKHTRLVVGLMSGTSLDGIDAVVARLTGSGRELQIEQLAFVSVPYPDALKRTLLDNSARDTSSVFDLSQLNVRVAHAYAEAVHQAVRIAGLTLEDVDLIGSHGQTVHHIPDPTPCAGKPIISTLQIGDPSVLANLLSVPVVGDFRVADMALGGQGAPLVPYFDFTFFSDAQETRGLLNLGGIANLSVLPRGGGSDSVYAFDTGPANMVIDALTQHFFRQSCDYNGDIASKGHVNMPLLVELLKDVYFEQAPPKSTGRERYGKEYIDQVLAYGVSLPPEDLLATVTMLTSASIYQAYVRFVRSQDPLDVLIVSGGGRHNAFLMQKLADSFDPIPVRAIDDYGLDPDAKEALCFAMFAHETINGVPTNMPSVTGAERPTLLGKICVPL